MMARKKAKIREILSNLTRYTFIKTFLLLIIAVSIPSLCIGSLSIKYSFDHIISQAKQSSGNYLDAKLKVVEQRLENFDGLIGQFISRSDIWKFLTKKSSSDIVYYRLSDIKAMDVFNLHYTQALANDLVYSIYMYEETNEFLYSDNKYKKNGFSDSEILSVRFDSNRYVTPARMIEDTKVFSYIRKYRVFSNDDYLYVVVNIKYDPFFSDLMAQDGAHPFSLVLYGPDDTALYRPAKLPEAPAMADLRGPQGEGGAENILRINDTNTFAIATQRDDYGLTLAYLQDYDRLVEPAELLKQVLLTSFMVVFSLSLIIAFIFSTNLYAPLAKLARKISGYSSGCRNGEKNDFKIIDAITQDLFANNRELSSKCELILPYFEQYSILDIMNSRHIDAERYKSVLSLIGVNFTHANIYIALLDFDKDGSMDTVNSRLREFFAKSGDYLSYVLSEAGDGRVVLLINSNRNSAGMDEMASHIRQWLQKDGICITLSVSASCQQIEEIYDAYMDTLKQHEKKCFFRGGLIDGSMDDAGQAAQADGNAMEAALLNAIKAQNAEAATDIFSRMLDKHVKESGSIEFIKYWVFKLINGIAENLAGLGLSPQTFDLSETTIFSEINDSVTAEDLKRLMGDLIRTCSAEINEYKKLQHSGIVRKAIEYIKANYMNDIGLDDVASSVFLNTRYLCNLFKAETHFTVMEYLTKYRMEVALGMLEDRVRVKEIAASVGYNNIQSFIRFFKNQYGMTPTDYRRKRLLQIEIQE